MLTYEIYTSRRSINITCFTIKMLDKTTSYMFNVHNNLIYKVNIYNDNWRIEKFVVS